MKQNTPATPPTTMAIHCLKVCEMPRKSNTQIGVSRPTKWPAKMTRMPTWNRFEPQLSCRRRSIWLDPLRHVYCSRSKRTQTAEQEDGQAEVGVPAEDDIVDQVAHGCFLSGAAFGA